VSKLSPTQQSVIDALNNNQRLLCLEHTSIGVFAGKLYNSPLSRLTGQIQKRTLKALIAKGALTEKRREVWQKEEGKWTMYKLEYGLKG